MERRHKWFLKINLTTVFFVIVSFISATLAWFAYSGLSDVSTDIDIKAWNIELSRNGEAVSNEVVISLPSITPGMETNNEVINIKNLGDSDAMISYNIVSARILGDEADNYIANDTVTTNYIEDALSHKYPFHINISLDKGYAVARGGESKIEFSVSWPFDSGDNELDTTWGNKAYEFNRSEQEKYQLDNNYKVKTPISVVIKLSAEQYVKSENTSDYLYSKGDQVKVDVANKQRCYALSETCIQTVVINKNSLIKDQTVTLLPVLTNFSNNTIFANYTVALNNITNGWQVDTRGLTAEDLISLISTDINDSVVRKSGLSDIVVGNLDYPGRLTSHISSVINSGSYYAFANNQFDYLKSDNCIWTSTGYDVNKAFAFKKISDSESTIYSEDKDTSCKVMPVIIINKEDIN